MGIRYSEGALIPDNTLLSGPEEPTGRRRQYVPSADPGSRLPHMNVRALASEVRSRHSLHTYLKFLNGLAVLPAHALGIPGILLDK